MHASFVTDVKSSLSGPRHVKAGCNYSVQATLGQKAKRMFLPHHSVFVSTEDVETGIRLELATVSVPHPSPYPLGHLSTPN